MKNILKSSQFKKQSHQEAIIAKQKQISIDKEINNQNVNLAKYLCNFGENKGNRWLNNLQEKPLLQLMNEKIEFSQSAAVKPIQLNCYERLKTVLSGQNGGTWTQQKSKKDTKLLKNVAIFETEINKLQQNYRSLEKRNKSGTQQKKNRSYIYNKGLSNHENLPNKNSFSNALNSTLKNYAKENSRSHHQIKYQGPQNDKIKKTIKDEITEIKKQSFNKFIHHKKQINDKIYVQLQEMMNNQLQKKIEIMVNRKIVQYDLIKEENSKFNTILLQKELQIENLRKELKLKQQKLACQMERQEPHQQMITLKLKVQKFYDDYQVIFGNISLIQLRRKLEYMENTCLDKYTTTETQHLEIYSRLKYEKLELQQQLKKKEQKFLQRQQQLSSFAKRREKYEQLDNSEQKHEIYNRIPQYKLKIADLQRLQKYILNKYVEWLDSTTQSEAKIIKIMNGRSSLQDYEQMIGTMLYYNKQFQSSQNQTSFIGKLLGAILKINKLIAPNKLHQKLQPLKSLEEVQFFLRNLKNRRRVNKKKTIKTKTEFGIENQDYMTLNQ